MPGPLTWKNVDTPDFRGTMDGYKVASDLFSRALGAASNGIEDVEAGQTKRANNAVMSDLLAYQGDPDRLTKDLASGMLQAKHGNDWGKVDSGTLAAISKAPADFLAFAKDKLAFGEQQKTVADNDLVRGLREKINEHARLGITDPTGVAANAYISDPANADLRKLSPDDYKRVLSNGLELGRDSVTAADGRQNYLENVEGYQQSQEERAAELASNTLYQEALRTSEGEAYFNNNKDAIIKQHGERAFNLGIARFQNGGSLPAGIGGGGGSVGGGTGGVGAGGKNVYDVLLGDGQGAGGANAYGFNTGKPLSQMTMGELYDYQRSTMVPKTAALGVGGGQGSSAAGAYQIVSRTMERIAPQLFGANWREMKFDAAAQDQMGEALFNEAKQNGTDLHKVWEGLPPGTSPRNETWASIRDKITRAESGGVVDAGRATVGTKTAIEHSNAGDETSNMALDFLELSKSRDNATQVARRLTMKGGTFEGDDFNVLEKEINKIIRPGINAAMAGGILARSRMGATSYLNFTKKITEPGMNSAINYDKVKELTGFAGDRAALVKRTVGIYDDQQAVAGIDANNAKVEAATAAYQQALQMQRATGRAIPAWIEADYRAAVSGQGAALRKAAPQGMAGVEPPEAAPAPRRQANTPATNPVAKRAEAVLRQRGIVGERARATFTQQYGMTPQQALNGGAPNVGRSQTINFAPATPQISRTMLKANAFAAVAQGPAAIARYKQTYGQDPRVIIKN